MKATGNNKKSIKEQELDNFHRGNYLTLSGAITTNQLEIIQQWAIQHKRKPVKAIFTNKRRVCIETIELIVDSQDHPFYKEVSWDHWFEIFTSQQLKFIFTPSDGNSQHNVIYKLSK